MNIFEGNPSPAEFPSILTSHVQRPRKLLKTWYTAWIYKYIFVPAKLPDILYNFVRGAT